MNRRLAQPLPAKSRTVVGTLTATGCVTALSGCMYFSPSQTVKPYEAADGVNSTLGSIQMQNALIVTSAKGRPGELLGMVVNNGSSQVRLVIGSGRKSTTVTIPAQTALRLGGKRSGDSTKAGPVVRIPTVTARPGESQSISVSSGREGSSTVRVPILLDQYPYGSATDAHPTYTPPKTKDTDEPPA